MQVFRLIQKFDRSVSFNKKELKAQARARDILIETAFRLFSTQGYHHTTIEDIVRESQISKGLLFYHFKHKEGLLDAIISESMADIRKITRLPSHLSDSVSLFDYILQQYINSLQDHRPFWQLYAELILRPGTREKVLAGGMYAFQNNLKKILRELFEKMGMADVEQAISTFNIMAQGMLWGMLAKPEDYPLEEMKAVVRINCLSQLKD